MISPVESIFGAQSSQPIHKFYKYTFWNFKVNYSTYICLKLLYKTTSPKVFFHCFLTSGHTSGLWHNIRLSSIWNQWTFKWQTSSIRRFDSSFSLTCSTMGQFSRQHILPEVSLGKTQERYRTSRRRRGCRPGSETYGWNELRHVC